MTNPPHDNWYKPEHIEGEALAWLAQLDGDNLSEKDLMAFREWVNRSPAHAKEIQKLNALWGELNVLTDMVAPIAEADAISRQLRRQEQFRTWRRRLTLPIAALASVAVFSVSIVGYQASNHSQTIQTAEVNLPTIYRTQIGERQEHKLPDGSTITLNTGSRVEVDFQNDKRRVRLLEGEAFFDVAHDVSRPFLVYAGDGIVRAVGTAFVVRLKGDKFDVFVSEGAVELSSVLPTPVVAPAIPKLKKLASLGIVKAGQSAKYENAIASIASLSEVEMTSKMSWQQGTITFSGETLEEVINEVSRYTELKITVKDEELNALRVGGVFEVGDTDSVLDNLRANFEIDTIVDSQGSVVLLKRQ